MQRHEALAILDVSAAASLPEIRAAYRVKVKEAHPDVGGTAEMFERVTAAYQLLAQQAPDDGAEPEPMQEPPNYAGGSSKRNPAPDLAAFGPVSDPLIRTDKASISRLKT